MVERDHQELLKRLQIGEMAEKDLTQDYMKKVCRTSLLARAYCVLTERDLFRDYMKKSIDSARLHGLITFVLGGNQPKLHKEICGYSLM